jgi:hypothetical protein
VLGRGGNALGDIDWDRPLSLVGLRRLGKEDHGGSFSLVFERVLVLRYPAVNCV